MARIEILAPVGSEEMLRAAVFSGADAVYLGFSGFNARTGAGNFDADSLQEAVRFCHARGVAVHVALNTTVYGTELPALEQAIRAVAASGADAVICQDLAVATLIGNFAARNIQLSLAFHRYGFRAAVRRYASAAYVKLDIFLHIYCRGGIAAHGSGSAYINYRALISLNSSAHSAFRSLNERAARHINRNCALLITAYIHTSTAARNKFAAFNIHGYLRHYTQIV